MPPLSKLLGALVLCAPFLSAGCVKDAAENPTPTGSVSGTVFIVNTSQPVTGVLVSCAGRTATTTASGTYDISGIAAGTYTLTASKSDFEQYSTTLNIGAGTHHDVYLTSSINTAILFGVVRHQVFGPISGVHVQVAGLEDWTDANGQYQLPNVPQNVQSISFTHDDYNPLTAQVFLFSATREYDAVLTKNATLYVPITEDAHVLQASVGDYPGTGDNVGTAAVMYAHYFSYANGNWLKESAFMMIPGISKPYSWAQFRSARIEFRYLYGASPPLPSAVDIYSVFTPWSEMMITGNNAPMAGQHLASFTFGATATYDFDVTDLAVAAWGAGPLPGVVFRQDSPQLAGAGIASSENSTVDYRPRLAVIYEY